MNHQIFSIYDSKAEAYLPPFVLHRSEIAARTFSDCINSETHQFGAHPADYTLFNIGEFDDETGHVSPHSPHNLIGNGVNFKLEPEPAIMDVEIKKNNKPTSQEILDKIVGDAFSA